MNELITGNKLIASLVLVAIAWVIRWLAVRHLGQRPNGDDEQPKRWINTINNLTNLAIALGLMIIWLSELRYMALSIAAFAVALVVATREFIQCFLGSLYIASNRTFVIGDWIKIGSHYGEVARSDWFSTTLLEIDMENLSYGYTGKSLSIPNHQFVGSPVQNLNFMRRYISHSFTLTREADINVFDAKAYILEKANEYCAPFQEVAQRYTGLIEKRLGIQLEGTAPSVRVSTSNIGKNVMTITIFCPTQEAVNIEQQLTEDFMAFWYAELNRLKKEKEKDKESKKHDPEKISAGGTS
ncbi:mechanosensitive ion channel family protein [Photobacterium sp. TY1-4]|uniref:mechanosensitive ion channel family protein n=1 Tax=Photobacterium sp. TY1-4 TaxID=2899122 RepID=UPI0021C24784|nr:mechanosensitive ion channel family protein [Photobacterium sp. TY1-4]UXI03858.1 mechanosensitive ion channel family protein [Photobacterium sp. TY1-4]